MLTDNLDMIISTIQLNFSKNFYPKSNKSHKKIKSLKKTNSIVGEMLICLSKTIEYTENKTKSC
jgi:hypothetical protein